MQLPSDSILLLTKQPSKIHILIALLRNSKFSVLIATSETHAAQQVIQFQPFLIILAGAHQAWSRDSLNELRNQANSHHTTLVALSDFHAPNWVHQDENPCFDGFLVNPISHEILLSLVQSAHTRQICSLVAR